jgi:branched-chain amino acid transport system ATP-binding protein/urea transport system ATP-binding protein
MTAEETAATGELVRQLVAELQVSAIIIEHDINFIRSLRAPITVMHLGRVLVEGPFEQVECDAEVREVYLGGET